MKKNDLIFIACVFVGLLPFFIFPQVYAVYEQMNANHAFLMGFVKFGLLATIGESLALRVRKGVYNEPGFGIPPRALVWGFLGMWIVLAMKVFGAGAPMIADYILGTDHTITQSMREGFSFYKLIGAFSISVLMNTSFAPIFMTLHKITDTHIIANGGTLRGFFHPIHIGQIMSGLNWNIQWNFVFKKTIPFFWIPAHTITFLLPVQFQVLFAALLGVALGLIMAVAANKK
ncbi:MAG: hypothetical protein RR328_01800 [Bacteroidales bacterium]